jgi:hypothetical protein
MSESEDFREYSEEEFVVDEDLQEDYKGYKNDENYEEYKEGRINHIMQTCWKRWRSY